MANKKYVCPICGKTWYTEKDVANCVTKDAAEVEKKNIESRKLEAERKGAYADLSKSKDLIEKKYEELRTLVHAYNTKAQDYATKYKQPLSRCDITCSFRTICGKNPWDSYVNKQVRSCSCDRNDAWDSWCDSLRDVIRKELNF